MFALDLDVIEAMRQQKALDLGALGLRCAIGHQRQLDTACLEFIDGVMRAGEDEHFLIAVRRKAVGDADREIGGGKAAPGPPCRSTRAHPNPPLFFPFLPPPPPRRPPAPAGRSVST